MGFIELVIPWLRRFSCDKCERSYCRKEHLRRHQRLECGREPSFKCQVCGKCCTHRSNLNRHIMLMHQASFISEESPLSWVWSLLTFKHQLIGNCYSIITLKQLNTSIWCSVACYLFNPGQLFYIFSFSFYCRWVYTPNAGAKVKLYLVIIWVAPLSLWF